MWNHKDSQSFGNYGTYLTCSKTVVYCMGMKYAFTPRMLVAAIVKGVVIAQWL